MPYAFAWLIGNLIIEQLAVLPAASIVLALFITAIVLLLSFCYCRKIIIALVGLALLSASYTAVIATWQINKRIPSSQDNHRQVLTIDVESLPNTRGQNCSFIAYAKRFGRLKLAWYRHRCPAPNTRFTVLAKLKKPRAFADPGAFDFTAWALANNIQATGYIVRQLSAVAPSPGWHFWQSIRYRIKQQFEQLQKNNEALGFIEAIAIGDRSLITPEQWQILRATGTNHLVAIAGLHIGFVATMVYFLMNLFWRRQPRLMLMLPAQVASVIAASIGGISYSMLSGLALPTERALLMMATACIAVLKRRSFTPFTGFSFGMIGILILNPLATLTVSFYLSFAAVYFIIAYLQFHGRHQHPLISLLGCQLALTLGLAPIISYAFGSVAHSSLIANSIAIPVTGFIIIPLALIAAVSLFINTRLANFCLIACSKVVHLLWSMLSILSSWQLPMLSFQITSLLNCAALTIALALWFMPKGFIAKRCALIVFASIFLPSSQMIPAQHARVAILDVGQGLSAIIQTAHHVLIYDTGPSFSPTFNAATAVIEPLWKRWQLKTPDTLILSHSDLDHIGGAADIKTMLHPSHIFSSFYQPYFGQQHCLAGQHWQWDGVQFTVLYPGKDDLGANNNSSCVLLVTANHKRLLLPGDIEHDAELKLARRYPHLTVDVLVAAHHGSHTSSTARLIEQLRPKVVVFPAGFHNRYYFPHPSVRRRFAALKSQQFITGSDGMITLMMGKDLVIKRYRSEHRRYWRATAYP